MNIKEKQKLFDAAIEHEACSDAIEWIKEIGLKNVTLDNLPADWGLWAIRKIGLEISDKQFERWWNECPLATARFALSRWFYGRSKKEME